METVRRKAEVLERHCEAEGRDPGTILKTIMAPVLLALDERQAKEIAERTPPEHRALFGCPMRPEQAAEKLRPPAATPASFARAPEGSTGRYGAGLAGAASYRLRTDARTPWRSEASTRPLAIRRSSRSA